MHALIVIVHPNPKSLTHSIASQIVKGVSVADKDNTLEIADLAAEGFNPCFTAQDISILHGEADPPPILLPNRKESAALTHLCWFTLFIGGRFLPC